MKKNNRGFMLAEVVVTSTVVIVAMTSLYLTFNKIYNKYNILYTYQNVDGVYAINQFIRELIYDGNINRLISQANSNGIHYASIISSDNCQIDTNYCDKIKEAYSIKNMYIVKKHNEDDESSSEEETDEGQTGIEALNGFVTNATFKDYLDYISDYYKFDGRGYIMVIEYEVGGTYNYSSLELNYPDFSLVVGG